MTRLGQMLFNDGFNDGFNNGSQKKQLEIARNLIGKLSDTSIAETTGLSLDVILELEKKKNYETIKSCHSLSKKQLVFHRSDLQNTVAFIMCLLSYTVRPISRVMSLGDHLSRPSVARRLQRPT